MNVVPKIKLTSNGPEISKLIQGYWRLSEWGLSTQECLSFIKQNVELGITTADHAHIYGTPSCEMLFGNALKLDPGLRSSIEIVTKCGIKGEASGGVAHYDSSHQAIIHSVESSLAHFGTEYLDILLIHRPDYLMNADEIAHVFSQLKREGKVNCLGVSNFTIEQFDLLQSRLDEPLATNQIEINPVNCGVFDSGVLEKLQRDRVTPMAWSCLAGGSMFNERSQQVTRLMPVLEQVASEIGASSIDQVIYVWVMTLPSSPVPILGSGNRQRIQAAVESLALSMTREQWYRIFEAARGQRVA